MKNQNQHQQGDVLLRKVDAIPEGAKPVVREGGRLILARGEATGHHHAIASKDASLFELDGVLYLDVRDPVVIEHEEHGPQTLPPGTYRVDKVREHDYFQDAERRVVD